MNFVLFNNTSGLFSLPLSVVCIKRAGSSTIMHLEKMQKLFAFFDEFFEMF